VHPHQFKLAAASRDHGVDGRGRRDVIARLEVDCRLRKAVERDQFAPRVGLGEASALGE
jgi:hypothetical protein